MKKSTFTLFLCIGIFSTVGSYAKAEEKLKVYILAGQSNMQGHCRTTVIDNRFKDPELKKDVEFLFKDGALIKRNDVSIYHVDKKMYGPLSAGYGADSSKIGPELGFGFTIGNHHGEQVLIIKAAWGGKSIFFDFLSPNGKRPNEEFMNGHFPKMQNKYKKKYKQELNKEQYIKEYGKYYRMMMDGVQTALKNYAPNHKEQGYEFAGFVWFQGYNDMFSDHSKDSYQDNMAQFIRDVRQDLKSPKLPFVIGAMGHGGKNQKGSNKIIANAQIATAEMDEFKGNVITVKTTAFWDNKAAALEKEKKQLKKYTAEQKKDYYKRWNKVGSNQGYHYHGSASFFLQAGSAFAEAIIKLQ